MGDKNNVTGRVLWNRDVLYDAKSNMLLAKDQDIHLDGAHLGKNIAVVGKTGIRMFHHEGINSVYESLVYRTETVEYGLFIFKDEASLRLYWENIRGRNHQLP